MLAIGAAYRDIKEYERATIVWRGLIEASYLEDARVGELLRQRGQTLESLAYLVNLWRSYPETASIESDFFGLSQVLVQAASKAFTDPTLRRELAAAGITRSQLLLQSIRMIQTFLAQSPRNPMADEASLALVGAFIELEDFRAVVRLSARFAKLFPKSSYLDSFQYSEALGDFHLGRLRPRDRGRRRRSPGRPTRTPRAPTSPARTSGRRSTSSARSTTRAGSPPARSNTTSRWPTASPTPPARSSPTRARS